LLEQASRDGNLAKLESYITAMADGLGSDLDQLFPQRRERPVFHLLWQRKRPHEVGEIMCQGVKLKTHLVVAELAA
jgi:hypothetical protein